MKNFCCDIHVDSQLNSNKKVLGLSRLIDTAFPLKMESNYFEDYNLKIEIKQTSWTYSNVLMNLIAIQRSRSASCSSNSLELPSLLMVHTHRNSLFFIISTFTVNNLNESYLFLAVTNAHSCLDKMYTLVHESSNASTVRANGSLIRRKVMMIILRICSTGVTIFLLNKCSY